MSNNNETENSTAADQTEGLPERPDAFAPESKAKDDDTLSAAEALEKIRAGKEIVGATINRLQLTGEFTEEIKLTRCRINRLVVTNARFKDRLAIVASELYRPRFTDGCVFEKSLDFRGSDLRGAIFRKATAHESVRMDNATLRGLRIDQSKFHGNFRTWQTRFTSWVTVMDCEFLGRADLRSFHADEGVEFGRCRFAGDVLVRGSTVSKKFSFSGSKFEGLLDLSKAKLHDFVYLEDIEQGENQRFAFHNAIFDRLLISSEQIDGRLASEEAGDHGVAMHEYGQLKRNFEALNRYEDEDWAFYRFKVNQRKGRPISWWNPASWLTRLGAWLFLDRGCGYGAKPFRAVFSALVIMLIFAAVYGAGIEQFEIDSPPIPEQAMDSMPNRAVFGATTSVSVFTTGLAGDHLQTAHGWMLAPLAVEALLGTLLWGLFIVAFSRKVIR